MNRITQLITLFALAAGVFSSPVAAKQKDSLDKLVCTQEGDIAKIVGGEWTCSPDLTGGGSSGPLWSVLDANDLEVDTFFGFGDGGGTVNGEQRHPSTEVFVEIAGENFLVTLLGSGFGSRRATYFEGPVCSGVPLLRASDIRRDSTMDGLYGTQGFVGGDPMRTLRVPVGTPFTADVLSALNVDGSCYEWPSTNTIEVISLDDVVELHAIFTPPFRLVRNF